MSTDVRPPQGGASQKYGAGAACELPSPPLLERGPGGESSGSDPDIQRAVRRTVGIAALHRIQRIVDADNALEASKQLWARRLSICLIILALLALAWIAIR